jgi:hypothetical protein
MRTEMRTTVAHIFVRLGGPAFLVVALISPAVASALDGATASGATYRLPAADVLALQDLMSVSNPLKPAVTGEQAIAVIDGLYSFGESEVSIDPYLEAVTMPGTFGTDSEIDGRTVWIVRATGLEVTQPAPLSGTGSPTRSHTLHTAYAFVDAKTGDFLLTIWQE